MSGQTSHSCGYEVTRDGHIEPCGQPATLWRWYQDVEHPDVLAPTCIEHANEGGRWMYAAKVEIDVLSELLGLRAEELERSVTERDEYREVIERVRALADEWDALADRSLKRHDVARAETREGCADDLRALLRDTPTTDERRNES